MIKRRAKEAGLPETICCHTFRATGITAYLENGGTLENAQQIAAHEAPDDQALRPHQRPDHARRGRADRSLIPPGMTCQFSTPRCRASVQMLECR